MMLFDRDEYTRLWDLCTRDDYRGYDPTRYEVPNGDGRVDFDKVYVHVALKYDPPKWALTYLARAHFEACRVAEAIGVPPKFYPNVADGTLRALWYAPHAGSVEHTDFSLFTIHCYRDHPEDFFRLDPVDARAEDVSPDVHIGELGELVGLGKATRHMVPARSYAQRAIVYFAMPSLDATLPTGSTVREWLAERYSRSRVYR